MTAAPGPRCQICQICAGQIFGASRTPSVPVKTRRPPRPPRASLALARRRASALNRPKTRPTAAKRDRTPEPPPCSFSVVRSTPTASLENRASSRAPSPCTLRASRSTSAHAQCQQRLGPGSQASHGPTAVHAPHMRTPFARPTEDGTLMSWPHYWRHAGSTYTHTPTTRPTADGTLTSRDCTGPGLGPPSPLTTSHGQPSRTAHMRSQCAHTHVYARRERARRLTRRARRRPPRPASCRRLNPRWRRHGRRGDACIGGGAQCGAWHAWTVHAPPPCSP